MLSLLLFKSIFAGVIESLTKMSGACEFPKGAGRWAATKNDESRLTLLLRETVDCPSRHSSCFLKREGSRCFGSEIFPN